LLLFISFYSSLLCLLPSASSHFTFHLPFRHTFSGQQAPIRLHISRSFHVLTSQFSPEQFLFCPAHGSSNVCTQVLEAVPQNPVVWSSLSLTVHGSFCLPPTRTLALPTTALRSRCFQFVTASDVLQ